MWLRIDFQNGQRKFVETDLSFATVERLAKEGGLIKVNRSLALFPHQGEGDKQGLAAIQLKDVNPSYMVCGEEFLVAN